MAPQRPRKVAPVTQAPPQERVRKLTSQLLARHSGSRMKTRAAFWEEI
jgi:hypothetical protein